MTGSRVRGARSIREEPELRRRIAYGTVLLLLLLCGPLDAAQTVDAGGTPQPGTALTVFLATMGPGDSVWEKFGHNAIWIHDAVTGSTISYNYGMFDFAQPGFVRRLMRGRMLYSMGVRDADDELAVYAYYNRSVTVQRLDLTAAQAHELREFLEWNWQPANRDYLYDPFLDNCSTRLRDAIDRALGGGLRAAWAGVPAAGATFRWHSVRLTQESLGTYTGLMLGLGMPTDRPLDLWDDAFIPMQLMAHMRTVRVPGPAGTHVPLVADERVLFEATRAAEPGAPPARSVWYLLAGIIVGGGLAVLGGMTRRDAAAAASAAPATVTRPRSRRAAATLAVLISAWGAVNGTFGTLLALLWIATDHTYAWANQNLLQVNPLALLLAFAAPLAIARRAGARFHAVARFAWPVALALLALSTAGLLLHIIPGFNQASRPIIAFALPVHAGVVLALYRALDRETSSAEDVSARMTLPAAA